MQYQYERKILWAFREGRRREEGRWTKRNVSIKGKRDTNEITKNFAKNTHARHLFCAFASQFCRNDSILLESEEANTKLNSSFVNQLLVLHVINDGTASHKIREDHHNEKSQL